MTVTVRDDDAVSQRWLIEMAHQQSVIDQIQTEVFKLERRIRTLDSQRADLGHSARTACA